MLALDDIRRKAANRYPDFIKAWLAGDTSFFPCLIRGATGLSKGDQSGAIAAVNRLRDGSKSVLGKGYSVEWKERDSQTYGRNSFPKRVFVETIGDFLWLAGKEDEFARFSIAAEKLRAEFPELNQWISSHVTKLTEIADQVDGVMSVVRYFRENPRPGLFARELPLSLPTKFIEWYQSELREWFDLLLAPASIHAFEAQFERRYGLKFAQPHLLLRTLDDDLLKELGLPYDELSLPVDTLSGLAVRGVRIFIVENKVNALTLPKVARSVVLGALGDGLTLLHRIPWVADSEVIYWGDIDADGFEALSSLRAGVARTRSLFMDIATIRECRRLFGSIIGVGNGRTNPKALNLTESENLAYQECCSTNLRIEQEHLPQSLVSTAICRIAETSVS
jgi:hypothetical protein